MNAKRIAVTMNFVVTFNSQKSRKLSAEKYFYHTNKEITDSLDIFSSHYADEAFNIWSSALHLTSNENGKGIRADS